MVLKYPEELDKIPFIRQPKRLSLSFEVVSKDESNIGSLDFIVNYIFKRFEGLVWEANSQITHLSGECCLGTENGTVLTIRKIK